MGRWLLTLTHQMNDMKQKKEDMQLRMLGFEEHITTKSWERRDGRILFVVRRLNERWLISVLQSENRYYATLDQLRYAQVGNIDALKAFVEKHVEGLRVKSLRPLQGSLINTEVYDLIKRSKRVAVRVLNNKEGMLYREMQRGQNGLAASTEMHQCFDSIKTGYYTMLKEDWERIKFLTKFI